MLYTLTTELPRYAPLPLQIIQDKRLSEAAKVLYALLLNQMQLSQKNNWTNADGAIYCNLTQKKAAEMMGKSERSVNGYFAELRKEGYLVSEHQGLGNADRLYLHVPQESLCIEGKDKTKQKAMRLTWVFESAKAAGYYDNAEVQTFLKQLVRQYNAATVVEAINKNEVCARMTACQQKQRLQTALCNIPLKDEATLECNDTAEKVIDYATMCSMPPSVIEALPSLVETYSSYAVQYQVRRCFEASAENPIAYLAASLKEMIS